jgi:hypothetical protein
MLRDEDLAMNVTFIFNYQIGKKHKMIDVKSVRISVFLHFISNT